MAFKTVNSLDADVTIAIGGKDKKTGKLNPTQAEGFYLGRREVASGKYSCPGKKDFIYFLQTPKGNLGIWGKTDLDRKMGGVTPGTMIRVTHDGMTPTPNGDMHKYKVEVDEDNTIDVSGLKVVQPNTTEDENIDEGYSTGYDSSDDDEETEVEEAPPARVAASASAARVRELLSKKAK